MSRAQIRIVDTQSEEISQDVNVSAWEKEQLLRKYGYDTEQEIQTPEIHNKDSRGDMSYIDMCRMEDARIERERREKQRKLYGPKPISFDGQYDSRTTSSEDGDSGFSFKVDIVSDMKIPRG
jgi:hypothetical protein